jgi:phage gp36-like protein
MPYCTSADIEQRMTTKLVAELTDDTNGSTVNAAVVSDTILLSDTDINDYLRGRYALPIAPTSLETLKTLRDFSLTLTEYRLYARRLKGQQMPELYTSERNRVMAELVKIQRGERTLDAQGAGENGRKPSFSRANCRREVFSDNELSRY